MDAVERFCERVVLLENGQTKMEDSATDVLALYKSQ